MVNENGVNHAATSAVLLGLVVRSFGLATGVGFGILVVTALFSL
jgi:hypothetical protein